MSEIPETPEQDLADWVPEELADAPIPYKAPLPKSAHPVPPSEHGTVTLVTDPFGTAETETTAEEDEAEIEREIEAEIAEERKAARSEVSFDELSLGSVGATASSEELPPLQLAPEDPAELNRLGDAMRKIDEELQTEAIAQAELDALESAALLARQIAEDQALAQAMAAPSPEFAEGPDLALTEALPKFTGDPSLDVQELMSCIEALVFMSDKPLGKRKLRELLGPEQDAELFAEAVTRLQERYRSPSHGVELVEVAGGYQFRTKPGRAALAQKLAKVQTQRLSAGAMETLAITAYKQPVMKEEIDKIRGVDSSYFVRILLDRKLIRISGRSELPGRPMLYSTTDDFLEIFGLAGLDSLPPLREIEQMIPGSESGSDEDPRVRELRKMVGRMNHDLANQIRNDAKEDEIILADIRERVKAVRVTTDTLEAQDAAAKAATVVVTEAPDPANS